MKFLFASLLFLAAFSCQAASRNQKHPQHDLDTKFLYSGYVSQSWVLSRPSGINVTNSSGNEFGSLDRTEIGVFASYRLNQNIDLRGNLKYDPSALQGKTPHLMFGLVDIHNDAKDFGIRIGRIRNPYGFRSSTRENPAERDLDYPPQSIYRESFRIVSSSGDGLQLYSDTEGDLGVFQFSLTVASPILKPQKELIGGFFGFHASGSYETSAFPGVVTVSAKWNSPDYKWAAQYSVSSLTMRYVPSNLEEGVDYPRALSSRQHVVGIRRYFTDWDITTEFSISERRGSLVSKPGKALPINKIQPLGLSVEARYMYNEHLTLYLGYSAWFNSIYDKNGNVLGSIKDQPSHRFYSRDFNFGVRLIEGNWIWRAEAHFVKGTSTLRTTGNPILDENMKSYRFFSTSLTYKF